MCFHQECRAWLVCPSWCLTPALQENKAAVCLCCVPEDEENLLCMSSMLGASQQAKWSDLVETSWDCLLECTLPLKLFIIKVWGGTAACSGMWCLPSDVPPWPHLFNCCGSAASEWTRFPVGTFSHVFLCSDGRNSLHWTCRRHRSTSPPCCLQHTLPACRSSLDFGRTSGSSERSRVYPGTRFGKREEEAAFPWGESQAEFSASASDWQRKEVAGGGRGGAAEMQKRGRGRTDVGKLPSPGEGTESGPPAEQFRLEQSEMCYFTKLILLLIVVLLLITLCLHYSSRVPVTVVLLCANIWFDCPPLYGVRAAIEPLLIQLSMLPQLFWTLLRCRLVGVAVPVGIQVCFTLSRRTSWTTWRPDTCPSKRGELCHHKGYQLVIPESTLLLPGVPAHSGG